MSGKKQKYYVVWQGHETGIFDTWAECKALVEGYPGPVYKSFASREEAETAYAEGPELHIRPKCASRKNAEADVGFVFFRYFKIDFAFAGKIRFHIYHLASV